MPAPLTRPVLPTLLLAAKPLGFNKQQSSETHTGIKK